MNTWEEIAAKLTEEFFAWGCRFKRKQLPEIAMSYDCTPLFFWNWLDGETEKNEKGFLRVLGYAWRKCAEAKAESGLQMTEEDNGDAAGRTPAETNGKPVAA